MLPHSSYHPKTPSLIRESSEPSPRWALQTTTTLAAEASAAAASLGRINAAPLDVWGGWQLGASQRAGPELRLQSGRRGRGLLLAAVRRPGYPPASCCDAWPCVPGPAAPSRTSRARAGETGRQGEASAAALSCVYLSLSGRCTHIH